MHFSTLSGLFTKRPQLHRQHAKLTAFKHLAAFALMWGCGFSWAQEAPSSYVLRGTGSGSLGGVAFSAQPFTLAFEGLGSNLTSGDVPYIAGNHPDWQWFSQDPLSRIIFSLPSANAITVVQNPQDYQLLAANFGSYRQIYGGGQTFAPFTDFSVCGSGQGQYDCWNEPNQFLAAQKLDFGHDTDGRVGLDPGPYQGFDFTTTRGALNLQITTPVPEPETYALMAVGLSGVVVSMRRKRKARDLSGPLPMHLAQA